MRLSDKCRKSAMLDPKGCKTAAQKASEAICKNLTGLSFASCMNANFDRQLIDKCGNVVCPGDPFMIAETAQKVTSATTAARADEGGFFDYGEQDLVLVADKHELEVAQGKAATQMRFLLLAGVGVLVVLAMARRK